MKVNRAESQVPSVTTSARPELQRVRRLLAQCPDGGDWQMVLARRVGALHAREGADLHQLLADVDDSLASAGHAAAAPRVTRAAMETWAAARSVLGAITDPLTGLAGADSLARHLDAAGEHGLPRVLVAEVMFDERAPRRGTLQRLEPELGLALLRAVLDAALATTVPWSRLGVRRLGRAHTGDDVDGLAVAVVRARHWLARCDVDADVAAWLEPVPTDPGARGALVRDLAM